MYPCMTYRCCKCGVTGQKLWRDYQTMLESLDLFCLSCALVDQAKDMADSEWAFVQGHSDQIGWLVPAIPTELPVNDVVPEDESYWGYSSVPDWGIKWWYDLAPEIPHPHPETQRKMLTRRESEEVKRLERKQYDDMTTQKINETVYVVDVAGEDYSNMWLRWHRVLGLRQDHSGMMREIGKVGDSPVAVTVFWYLIEGARVAFVEPTSRVVDHAMVEEWIEKTFPIFARAKKAGQRYPKCNMANFAHCIEAVAPGWSKNAKRLRLYEDINKVLLGPSWPTP